jgi:molecular chaperone GrpE
VTNDNHQDDRQPAGDDAPEQEIPLIEEAEPVDELAQVRAERDDYLDQLQRSRAEFINYRRRSEQERAALREFVTRDVVASFLPVADDFERALGAISDDERDSSWVKGVEMIQSKLFGTFERLGVKKVDALGQPFDPALHEAVATQPGSSGSTVVEVYQQGYRVGDTLVRPAMVMTGDPAPQDETEQTTATFNA